MKKEYDFKFSIIMSVYDVEDYIEESIESIINQDIGFQDNVQLIIVNDGSPDNSEKIIKKYVDKYPKNIDYVVKENGGLASAKNEGLKHIKGEYINFFDPDDTLPKNTLREVYRFFNINKLYIDMVTLPLYHFEAATGLHGKYNYIKKENHIVDLTQEPYNFILSSAASFYKHDVIKNKRFNEEMRGAEDTILNHELFLDNPKFGFVCGNGVRYNYRKREAGTSIVDGLKQNKKGFTTILNFFKNLDINNLKDFEKEMIIYELRSRIFNISPECFDSKKEYEELMDKYRYYINAIDDEFIFHKSKWAASYEMKMMFAIMKGKTHRTLVDESNIYLPSKLCVKNYKLDDKNVIIECIYYKYDNKDIELVVYDNDKVVRCTEERELDKVYPITYGKMLISKATYSKFVLPLKETSAIKFALRDNKTNKYIIIDRIIYEKFTKLTLKDAGIYLHNDKYKLTLNKRNLKVSKFKSTETKYKIRTYLNIHKNHKYNAIYRLFAGKKKKYILINDRPEKAGDNGEALFKHICEKRPDLKKYTYFVVSDKSDDYKRLKHYGNVVKHRSLKHKLLFMNTKIIYTSHTFKPFYLPFDLEDYKYYIDLCKHKTVWLQHGITKMDISIQANKLLTGCDYVITALEKEKGEFEKQDYLFDKSDVLLTGFARFDRLNNKPENIITICPTWRKNLSGKILLDGTHEALPGFEKTDYYKVYKEILTSPKVKKLLEKNNYKLKFVIHPGMANYLSYFKDFETDNILIVEQKDVNYSEIFSQTKLMITDFSSVYFDFVYMKKPMIHFHFDEENYFTRHYLQGYYSERRDGFGDVLIEPKEVIEKIEYYFKNDFKMEKKYQDRVDALFKFKDKNNCERILEETLNK